MDDRHVLTRAISIGENGPMHSLIVIGPHKGGCGKLTTFAVTNVRLWIVFEQLWISTILGKAVSVKINGKLTVKTIGTTGPVGPSAALQRSACPTALLLPYSRSCCRSFVQSLESDRKFLSFT